VEEKRHCGILSDFKRKRKRDSEREKKEEDNGRVRGSLGKHYEGEKRGGDGSGKKNSTARSRRQAVEEGTASDRAEPLWGGEPRI